VTGITNKPPQLTAAGDASPLSLTTEEMVRGSAILFAFRRQFEKVRWE
jgi:hypothetical protein